MSSSPERCEAIEALQGNYPAVANYKKTTSKDDQEGGVQEMIEEVEQPRASLFDVEGNENHLLINHHLSNGTKSFILAKASLFHLKANSNHLLNNFHLSNGTNIFM